MFPVPVCAQHRVAIIRMQQAQKTALAIPFELMLRPFPTHWPVQKQPTDPRLTDYRDSDFRPLAGMSYPFNGAGPDSSLVISTKLLTGNEYTLLILPAQGLFWILDRKSTR